MAVLNITQLFREKLVINILLRYRGWLKNEPPMSLRQLSFVFYA